MNSERTLILLPMDGSDQSMEVARYVAKTVNLDHAEVVLLSIIDKLPDIFWDTERDPAVSRHLEHMKDWDTYKEQKMRDCLQAACEILEAAGVPKSAVTLSVRKRERGIARDIIDESRFGYDFVAIGRSGLGRMDQSMLGSVAAKVFINVVDTSVCLLGGSPPGGRILVGLDNSLGSVRAVNFVSRMFKTSNTSVCLAHVARMPESREGKPLDAADIERIARERESIMKPVFDNAVKSLASAGFARENIFTKLIAVSGSRAVNLLNEAKTGGFGTIVVGRRGISDVAEFTMGRVPYKLGYTANKAALWLVS